MTRHTSINSSIVLYRSCSRWIRPWRSTSPGGPDSFHRWHLLTTASRRSTPPTTSFTSTTAVTSTPLCSRRPTATRRRRLRRAGIKPATDASRRMRSLRDRSTTTSGTSWSTNEIDGWPIALTGCSPNDRGPAFSSLSAQVGTSISIFILFIMNIVHDVQH